jgi:hypothetical protein
MVYERTQDRIEWVRHQAGHRNSLVAFRANLCATPPGDGYEAPTDSDGNYQISYEAMRQYHNENRPPPVHYLARLSELFNVRLDWLATRHGTPHSETAENVEAPGTSEETHQQLLEAMLEEMAGSRTVPTALQDPTIRGLLTQTVGKKVKIENDARLALGGHDRVQRSDVARWFNELVAHLVNPSERALQSWELPAPDEVGDEAWLSSVIATLQGVRERLSGHYSNLRTAEAQNLGEAAKPEAITLSDHDAWIAGGGAHEPGTEEEV